VRCGSGGEAAAGPVSAEGAARKQRRMNFGRKAKMESAGEAGTCLAVPMGVRTLVAV